MSITQIVKRRSERFARGARSARMSAGQIVGWKTYAVAAASLAVGVYMARANNHLEALDQVMRGLALVALRDAITKVLRAAENNRRAFDDLRATIEAHAGERD